MTACVNSSIRTCVHKCSPCKTGKNVLYYTQIIVNEAYMQNFLISFRVVFPIFLLMVLGWFIKRIKLVNDTTVKQVNQLIFRVFLPTMIFKNVYDSEIADVFNVRLIAFAALCVLGCIALLFLIVPLVEKENARRGVLIQGIFRSNFVIFGLPITQALCGDGVTGTASVLIAMIIPIFNFFAVISLEVFQSNKPNIRKILKGIVTNPLIIASVLGLLINFFGIRFPSVLEGFMGSVSSVTTPLALIILGASIQFSTVGRNAWHIVAGVGARLVLVPAVCLGLAVALGFRGAELAILLALFASPAAVSSFTMAQQMGGDDQLAGQMVMFGTTACVLTVFLWIFLFVQMGWI